MSTDNTARSGNEAASAEGRTSGRKRLVVAAGSLLAIGGLVTAAAFTDFANLNLGNGTDDSGVGGNNRFNIQVVGTNAAGTPQPGTWQEAATDAGVSINVPGADTITPGDTVSVSIPFRNESPKLLADIHFSLRDRTGKTSDVAMHDALRYSLTLNGTAIAGATNVAQSAINNLDLGPADFTPNQQGVLGVTITLPDQGSAAANNALQAKVSYVQAHFDATSVNP